jgi:hypothetical protein
MIHIKISETARDRLIALAGSKRNMGSFVERVVLELYEQRDRLAAAERKVRGRILAEALLEMEEQDEAEA